MGLVRQGCIDEGSRLHRNVAALLNREGLTLV